MKDINKIINKNKKVNIINFIVNNNNFFFKYL